MERQGRALARKERVLQVLGQQWHPKDRLGSRDRSPEELKSKEARLCI